MDPQARDDGSFDGMTKITREYMNKCNFKEIFWTLLETIFRIPGSYILGWKMEKRARSSYGCARPHPPQHDHENEHEHEDEHEDDHDHEH